MTISPETFANLVVTEANATSLEPIPVGEYTAYIKDQKLRQNKEWWMLDITWVIQDHKVAELTGRTEPTCRQSIFIDFTPEGALDSGKNRNMQLGKLREALNQNQKGKSWSPPMMLGQTALVSVTHRMDKNGDVQAEIKSVARI